MSIARRLLVLSAGLYLSLVCAAEPRVPAQTTSGHQSLWQDVVDTASPPDFGVLNARRKRLEAELTDLAKKREAAVIARERAEFDVRRLSAELSGAEARERSIESYLNGLGSSAAGRFGPDRTQAKNTLDEQKAKVQQLKNELVQARAEVPKAATKEAELDAQLVTWRADLDATERSIANVLNLDASKLRWRTLVAMIFCLLLAYLIYRFFQTSDKDDVVRRSVFSEHAGIQFVTLFCLVIAIVLFGIIGVLEGKELSALLGGLSGYILGRANGRQQAAPGGRGGDGSPPAAAPAGG